MEPEKIETSVSPIEGNEENKSITAMEAEKFEGLPNVAPVTFNPTADVMARLEQNRLLPKPKGTIKTIEDLETGDVIDCVDFWEQPAFNNPKVKEDYKKHYGDSFPPTPNIVKRENPSPSRIIQSWHKFGECPEGTVPIPRFRVLGAEFYKKGPPPDFLHNKKE